MQKIKILYTIPNFDTAGSQPVVKQLFESIDKTIFDPYLGVEKEIALIPDVVPQDRRLLLPVNSSTLKSVLKMRLLLKQHRIDLVHSWDYKSKSEEAMACRLAGVPYLYTKKNNSWSKKWFLKSLLAYHIAYDNPAMKQQFFSSMWLKNKITFIPHGVDTQKFYPKPKPHKQTFDLCCIGNINTNKNQGFLVKALAQLPENVHLYLYGNEAPEYAQIVREEVKSRALEKRVHFMGTVPNESVPGELTNYDVFVLASKNEGMPVSILEAQACGLPVLSTDSGGGSKYILEKTQGGFIFPTETTDAFVSQIKHLMDSPEVYAELSRNAVNNCQFYFNLQQETACYQDLYLKIIQTKID